MNRLTRPVIFSLFAVYVIWGSTYLGMRIAVKGGLPPMLMGGVRFMLAGAVLFTIAAVRGVKLPTAKQWLNAIPVGALFFVMGNGMVAIASVKISSGIAAVVCALMPLFAAAMGPFFGERSTTREWVGLVIGFVGAALLGLSGELRGDVPHALILVLAPLSWAVGSLLVRRIDLATGPMSAATQMLTGGVLMLAFGAVRGESVPTAPSTGAVLAFVYLVFFGSLMGFTAYAYLLKATRPAIAMSYSYVNPALAVFLGALLGGEHVGLETVGATALIIAGTFVLMTAAGRGKATEVSPAVAAADVQSAPVPSQLPR